MDDSSNTFVFLLTTDNHLGFMEKDPRRGPDSFVTFEECLRAARVRHNVDAVLLGGDLFHENKPSLMTLTRSMNLFSKYVLGDKDIPFRLLSDPKVNFPKHPSPLANFQNPNLNVALPIFTIYGNHDDPVGGCSAIDILSSAGLVNFFGHVENSDDIVIKPILLQKGTTRIALYGMGNVRDERLHRCFKQHKVRFLKPKSEGDDGSWFNILIIHQNRGIRSNVSKAGVEESMLKGFDMDLVIWGNEHEQLMGPQQSEGYEIIQPGSTVLTSLGPSESNPKMYGVLEVRGNGYRLTPYPLQSLRPVVRRTVELWKDNPSGRSLDAVERYLRTVADELIEEAEVQIKRIPQDVLDYHPNVRFPLMRISVDDHDPDGSPYPLPNVNRFGQQFLDVVVNADEVLRHIKPKGHAKAKSHNQPDVDGYQAPTNLTTSDIRTRIAEVLNANAKDACQLLAEQELSSAVYSFVEKSDKEKIDKTVDSLLNSTQRFVYKKIMATIAEQSAAASSSAAPSLGAQGATAEMVSHLAFEHKRTTNAQFASANDNDMGGAQTAAAGPVYAAIESILHRPVDDGNIAVELIDDDDNSGAVAPAKSNTKTTVKRTRAPPAEKPAGKGRKKEPEPSALPQLALSANSGADDTHNILAKWGK